MILFDIIFLVICLFLGFKFKELFSVLDRSDKIILNKLYIFHLALSVVFFLFIRLQGGDSTNYWFMTYDFRYFDFNDVLLLFQKGSATGSMLLLNYVPAKILGVSFLIGNIIYATVGFFGFVFFYAALKEIIPETAPLRRIKIFRVSVFPFLFFLPNLHFWSAGISKDTLLFFCLGLFMYSILKVNGRLWGIALSIILSFLIRPHITLFLIAAFGIGFVIDGKLKTYQKIFIFFLFIIGFIFIFDYVLQFVQLENFEAETIEQYTSKRTVGLSVGSGSGVDVSNYPYPVKVFTFLYRPLFIDAPNMLGILSSFENLILIIFTIKIFSNRPLQAFRKGSAVLKGAVIFFLLGAASFPLILGNLGIMLRQKNMFIPMLIIFGFWVFQSSYKRKYSQYLSMQQTNTKS